ncbi:MAG: lysoplasmalogenase [Chloroflexota bacterium]
MLNLPVSGVETIVFLIYLGLWAGLLFGGLVWGTLDEEENRRMPLTTRLLSSFVLVIAGWTWFAIGQGTSVASLALWIAIGMTLGFLGDVFMAQVFTVEPYVLYGMGAFGIGHVAYIIGMMTVLQHHSIELVIVVLVFGLWWAIASILWYYVVFKRSKPSLLVYIALPYALLLASTVAVAMLLTLSNQTYALIWIGAILFLVSDLILAGQLFARLHFRQIGDVVWLLYGPGQMLIVFGVILYTVLSIFI